MKPRILSSARASLPIASALTALFAVQSATAAIYYWDSNSTTAGFGNAGTWGTSAFWTTDSSGAFSVAGVTATTNADTVNIGTGSAGWTGTTLAINGSVTVNRIVYGSAQTGITLGAGTNTITLAGTTPTITVNGSSSQTIAAIVAGSAGLVKDGSGTLVMSAANTYTGGLVIKNGTINAAANAATVGGATNTISMGGAGSSGATLIGNTTINRALTINAPDSGVVILAPNTSGNSLTYSGGITLNGDLTVRAFSGGSAGTGNTTISGTLGGTGNLILSNTGAVTAAATSKIVVSNTVNHTGSITVRGDNAGTTALNTISGNIGTNVTSLTKEGIVKLVLSGTNTFTGAVNITAGTLELGSAGALNGQNAVAFTSGSTGILALNGNNATISNLSTHATPGATFVQNGHASTASTLTVGNASNLDGTYAGTIRNGAAGTLALTKAGTGTLTLSGLNSFTGNVTVNAGTLAVGVGGSGGNSALGSVSNTRTITINTGGTLRADVAGGIFNNTFSTAATSLPTLNIAGGTLTNGGTATNSALGNITLAGGTLTATSGTGSASGYGVWNLNGTVTSTGTSTISNSSSRPITLSAATGTNTTFDVTSGTLTVSAALGEVTATGDERVSSLTKTGAGTMILSGVNTYTGTTTVTAGTLSTTLATALPGYNTSGKVVFDGGTIATTMGDGASTGWSTAQVDTLLANATKTSGFLGIDSTNGSLNQWTPFLSSGNFGGLGLTKLGANTLTLDQANSYSGNTIISAGTLRLGDAAALGSSPLVSIGGNTLEIGTDTAFSGPNISIQAGTIVSDRATAGSGNTHVLGDAVIGNGLSNFTAGSNVSGGTAAIQIGNISNNNGSTATPGLNPTTANLIVTGNVTLGTSNTGTANLTLGGTGSFNSIAGVIENGTRATGNIIKSGTSTWTLSGLSATAANNYNGTTTINQGTLAFTTTSPSLSGGLTFGSANSTTTAGILDLTNADATFGGPLLVNANSATPNEIKIGAAQTLTVNGNVQIGATPPVANAVTRLNMTGGGVFNVATAAAGTFNVGGTTLVHESTLDLTALSATTINTSATGTIRVNANSGTNVLGTKSTLLLPTPLVADTVATATLTAGTIAVGNSGTFNSVAGQINTLQLGTGLTTLNADIINVGTGSRDIGQIIFAGVNGDVKIRAADGSSRATTFAVGTGGATTGTTEATTNNLVDFSGHDADILVTSLNVGNQARVGNLTSEFKFGAGNGLASVLDATNVNIGFRTGNVSTTSVLTNRVNLSGGSVTFGNAGASGTGLLIGSSTYSGAGAASTIGELNISGGNVTIHNGSGGFAMRLGQNTSANGGTVTASMNVTGGTTTLGGGIVRGTATGTVTSTLTLNGASAILDMGGNNITNLTDITYTDGTLKNIGTVNTGMTLAGTGSRIFDQAIGINGEIQGDIAGTGIGLIKQGDGKLTLSGTSSYTGDTDVTAGTLIVSGNISTSITTTVADAATLGGGGSVADLVFAGGSFFDIFEAVDNTDSLASTTITFSTTGFGIDNLVYNGAAVDWSSITNGNYTLITGILDESNLGNFGLENAYDIGGGRSAYFAEGSLQLVVIPEPRAALLGGLGMLALLRRRRR